MPDAASTPTDRTRIGHGGDFASLLKATRKATSVPGRGDLAAHGDKMRRPTIIDEDRLKTLLKSAVVEVLEERRELVRDLIAEALEDIAMARAIEEGAATGTVDPAEVYKILERKR